MYYDTIYINDIPEHKNSSSCTENVEINNRFDMKVNETQEYNADKFAINTDSFILCYLRHSLLFCEYRFVIKEDENTYVTYNFPLISNLYRIRNKQHEMIEIYSEGKTKEIRGKNVEKLKIKTLLGEFYIFNRNNRSYYLYATKEQMNHMLNFIKNTIKENMKSYKFKWKKLKLKSSRKCSIFNKNKMYLKG